MQRFGDATLSNTTYDVQGRRYAVSQDLTLNTMITVAASVWIPSDWVSATQNAGTCYLASGNAAQGQACARYLDFGVELGLDSGGKPASIERLWYPALHGAKHRAIRQRLHLGSPSMLELRHMQ